MAEISLILVRKCDIDEDLCNVWIGFVWIALNCLCFGALCGKCELLNKKIWNFFVVEDFDIAN